jgi:hypothetical protein
MRLGALAGGFLRSLEQALKFLDQVVKRHVERLFGWFRFTNRRLGFGQKGAKLQLPGERPGALAGISPFDERLSDVGVQCEFQSLMRLVRPFCDQRRLCCD